MKVSVVVPVFNPGRCIDELVDSLLAQSLDPGEFEVIFVDDGSTDGTGEHLDALSSQHDAFRVKHIPNSGWPGRPRNVGTDLAAGDYVYYADNDDWLGPEALERLHARAVADEADLVIGKVVGHGKHVPRALFAENRTGVTIEWGPLLWLMSPHKLFRRSFLEEHGIRFPEGRRRLEDHVFVLRAYFAAANRISVVADYPCYHWMRRDGDRENASRRRMDAHAYFGDLRDVLDVIDAHAQPGAQRNRLLAHWYRSKALWRLEGAVFLRREEDLNREIFQEVRDLVAERVPPEVDDHLPIKYRVRSRMVRAGDLDGIYELARYDAGLRATVTVVDEHRTSDAISLRLSGHLSGRKARLRFIREGRALLWDAPGSIVSRLEPDDLDAGRVLEQITLHVILRSQQGVEHRLPAEHHIRMETVGLDREAPRLEMTVTIDPTVAAAGAPIDSGTWNLVVQLSVGTFKATTARFRRPSRDGPEPISIHVDPRGHLKKDESTGPSRWVGLLRR